MNTKSITCAALTIAMSAVSAHAGTLWDELLSGDASGNPLAPSNAGVVMVGANIFQGSVLGGTDQRDYITFQVPAGLSVTGLLLQNLSPDNIVWTHFDDGPTSVQPDISPASLLAGAHIPAAAPNGTNLFGNYQAGSPNLLAGPGLSGALGPGTYTFLMQQTSGILTDYSLNFVVVPAPSAAPAVALLFLAMPRRRSARR
jgi:hypothetical protein